MTAPDGHTNKAQSLRSLIHLLVHFTEVVIADWEADHTSASRKDEATSPLPSPQLYEAQRIIQGACGMVVGIVQDPRVRLFELSTSFALAQAFDTTVRAGVPDLLAHANEDDDGGMPLLELSRHSGVNAQKLARVMRVLCSEGLYKEVKPLHYSNSPLSATLVGNKPAQAFQRLYNTECFGGAMLHLPRTLIDPEMTGATSVTQTAFQKAHKTTMSFWDVIEHGDLSEPAVAELREVFPLSMVGHGQLNSAALIADYPWASLGKATIVDVGGGVGSMSLELAKALPDLLFVVEDLPVHIEEAKAVWDAELPGAVDSGRVQLTVHDFFTEQPIKGADVYMLRCVLHDWADDECVKILGRLKDAMGPGSRVLVPDFIMHPPLGSPRLKAAPAPLPANYGQASRFVTQLDMVVLSLFNGRERDPEEFSNIARRAGLGIEKIWECRAPLDIIELRLLE